ncbi:MAG: hypothetical protein IPP55_15150 [Anaerolineales bacterium]|nr:hypothetical protein [Anaerolineales bacterium]
MKLSTTDPDRKWDNNEIAWVQATAERTALAIETARLLQEAQNGREISFLRRLVYR